MKGLLVLIALSGIIIMAIIIFALKKAADKAGRRQEDRRQG